jgi:hypothetical protein
MNNSSTPSTDELNTPLNPEEGNQPVQEAVSSGSAVTAPDEATDSTPQVEEPVADSITEPVSEEESSAQLPQALVEDAAETMAVEEPETAAAPTSEAETADSVPVVESEAPSSEMSAEQVTPTSSDASDVEVLVMADHELEEMESTESSPLDEDYSGFDKEQLVVLAEQLNRDHDPVMAGKVIQKIRPMFESLFAHDKAEALEKFIADGGDPEVFEYKHQALEQRFFQAQRGINEKRKVNQEFQAKERTRNLESKLQLLEQLRKLVADHEHTPGYDKFKEIREEWKKVGPVGSEHAHNLNASFYSLCDQFHSLAEIHNNLREFDRKKNLEAKLELIGKIEKLAEEPLISKAMKDLMTYQDEFRALGPVPKDLFEEIRDRFKKAVDVIYERRRNFNEERKKLMAEEVSLKEALLAKIAAFESFTGATAKDWQNKTKEIIQLQEEWKAVPNRFREKTGELNKSFWAAFKKFMSVKNEFFKELDKSKKDVLGSKQALVDEVHSLKDGDDWDGISNRMKQLQAEWKKLAPVFGKEGQKVYDSFKEGIDHFFTRLRDQRNEEGKVQTENLRQKEEICARIEALAAEGKGDRKTVDELKEAFRGVGYVPMKSIQKINGRYSKAMMELIDKSTEIPAGDKERMKIQLLSNRSTYSSEGVKALKNQESYIQKRLQQLRKDVGNLEDNMAMFKMSKNAMALMEDIQKKVNLSKMEIKELESQLKEIRNADKAES